MHKAIMSCVGGSNVGDVISLDSGIMTLYDSRWPFMFSDFKLESCNFYIT